MKIWLLTFFLTVGFSNCLHASDIAKSETNLTSNPLVAASLAGLVGFGSGHLYTQEKWTKKTSLFAGLDTLFLTMIFISPENNANHPNPIVVA